MGPFDRIILRIIRSSQAEPKDSMALCVKTQEELGEVAAEFIKKKGYTAKPYDPNNMIEEIADTLICIVSTFAMLRKEDPQVYTLGALIKALNKKIDKWNEKVNHYRIKEMN